MAEHYLVRVPVSGGAEVIAAENLSAEALAALLHTDVTERMRVPVRPPFLTEEREVLCYLIDARGGEKGLPMNFCGTCFYHTGCPVCGDLLLVRCTDEAEESAVFGFSQEHAQQLAEWVQGQFPAHFAE